MWKDTVQPDRPQMAVEYVARASHAGYQRLQLHTQNMYYLLFLHGNNSYRLTSRLQARDMACL